MRRAYLQAVTMVAFWAAGCAPTVHLHHVVEPDVPIPPGTAVGQVDVTGERNAPLANYIRSELDRRIASHNTTSASHELCVLARVETRRSRGSRTVRVLDNTQNPLPMKIPTTRMIVTLECDFALQSRHDDEPVILATASRYDSLEDPRVRGAMGIGRNDDPGGVPSKAAVLRELAGECLAQFDAMTTCTEHHESVRLRGPITPRVMHLVRRGEFRQAATGLEPYARSRNHPSLWFSLGVIQERLERFQQAVECYERSLAGKEDPQTRRRLRVASAMATIQDICTYGYEYSTCSFAAPVDQ